MSDTMSLKIKHLFRIISSGSGRDVLLGSLNSPAFPGQALWPLPASLYLCVEPEHPHYTWFFKLALNCLTPRLWHEN